MVGLPCSTCSEKPAFVDSSSTENVQRPVFRNFTTLPFRLRLSFPVLSTIPSTEPRNGLACEPTSDCCVEPFVLVDEPVVDVPADVLAEPDVAVLKTTRATDEIGRAHV